MTILMVKKSTRYTGAMIFVLFIDCEIIATNDVYIHQLITIKIMLISLCVFKVHI